MASTPAYGIVYPCSGETINPSALQDFASSMDAALAEGRADLAEALNRPSAQIDSVSNFSIVIATNTTLTFTQETVDNAAMADLAVNNDRLTVTKAGVYMLSTTVQLQGGFTTVTSFSLFALVNGVERLRYKDRKPTPAGDVFCELAAPLDLNVGDFVQIQARWTGTGGPANIQIRFFNLTFLAAH